MANDDLPWSDLRVCFGVDSDDKAWRTFSSIDGRHPDLLPAGWELKETDAAGARCVAIFQVTGMPTIEDGQMVRALIRRFKV